jgi:hypothetical protein
MNGTVFISLHVTNNTVNIVQMLALIVLSAFFELDYHLLKIDAGALWKRTYAHLVLLGLILVLRDQVNDCSNSRARNKSDIRDFSINKSRRLPPTQLCNGDNPVQVATSGSAMHSCKRGTFEDQPVQECFEFEQQRPCYYQKVVLVPYVASAATGSQLVQAS